MLGDRGSMVPAVNSLNPAVTTLDWIIIAFTVLMAVWGYQQGLIAGALSLAGFAAGALIGSRLGPLLLEDGSHSPYAPLFALLGALMIGGLFASGLELLGFHLRRRLGDRLELVDGVGGALLVACLGLFLVWIGGSVALQTPGARELREPIQRSAILKELNEVLPPSGGILKALARFDPFPSITGPSANVPPPDAKIARDPDVQAAGRSVVRVLGTACGLGVQGSGWVAGNGIVVTNAHVVAGQDDTTVQPGGDGPGARSRCDLVRPPQRPLDPARAGSLRCARAVDEGERRAGYLGGRARLPRERAVHRGARPPRADRHGDHAGRLRARAGAAHDHLAARPGAAGQLRRAGGRRRPGAWSRRSSPRPPAAGARATGSRTRSCATRCGGRAGRWTPGPAPRAAPERRPARPTARG